MAKSESNKAVANLMQWLKREAVWTSRFDALMTASTASTLDANAITFQQLSESLGDADSQLFGCIFEHLCALRFSEAPNNFVDDYLKRRGWRDSIPSRLYMEALRDAVLSIYEITAVQPGAWVDVKDLVRNTPSIRIRELSGSMGMARWDKIAARIVNYQGEKLFTGVLIRYSTEQAQHLLNTINNKIDTSLEERALVRINADKEVISTVINDSLLSLTEAFTVNWLKDYFAALHASSPPLFNFEGDPIQFTQTRFVLEMTATTEADVTAYLDAVPNLRCVNDVPPTWDWLGYNLKPMTSNKSDCGMIIQSSDGETGAQILGTITLDAGVLLLDTNSLARSQSGIAILEATLGHLIKTKLTSLITIEEMMARHPEDDQQDSANEISPPIVAETMREFLDKHYQSWIDTPLPALDGRTPRQAIKTKSGKDEVVVVLKYMENMEGHRALQQGECRYDFGWLWRELGLAARRH